MNLKIDVDKNNTMCKCIPCEIFSRVSGYFRPTMSWNAAKKEEFRERRMLKYDRYPGAK